LKSRYDQSIEKTFQIGQQITAVYSEDNFFVGTVVEIQDRENPWEKYTVDW